jgi:anaerobic selenocysteine-containing dehydrogenase
MRKPAQKDTISRRDFLDVCVGGTVALGAELSGCSNASDATVTHGCCHHDCPDTCAWLVTSQDGKIVKLEADKTHPFTRGVLCPSTEDYLNDVVFHHDRLLHPLRRVGAKGEGKFERVTWDQAMDGIAEQLKKVLGEDGPTAVLPYSYAGTQGIVQGSSLDRRFFARLGATRLERQICGDTSAMGVTYTLGTTTGIMPEDVVNSRLVLIWGSNPRLTYQHGWKFIEEAKRRGARIVVIDPQKSATAAVADWHLQPKSGTDAALALGMMNVIVSEGRHDQDYVKQYTVGFDALHERIVAFTPQRVAEITGLRAEDIRQLAREYAKERPSTIQMMIGMEHRSNGGMAYRTVTCLPALVGAWRELGGGLLYMTFELGALNYKAAQMPELEDKKIRSVNMVQLGKTLTDKTLKPPIRALIVYNSNPATIAPNQTLVKQGLQREDLLTVVLEQFLTDTARYADYVLPAATQVEVLDLQGAYGQRYISLNQPATAPRGEAKPNTEFFRLLAARLGMKDSNLYDTDEQIVRAALQTDHPYMKGITYERLQKEGWAAVNLPEPWIPFAKGNFPTPSRKCEFYSAGLKAKGLDPLPNYTPVKERVSAAYPLELLTPKNLVYSINSSYVGFSEKEKQLEPPRLRIHQRDAATRGIQEGDTVRVFNQRGSMLVRAQISDTTRPGVVSMPHGWWASRLPGGSSANAVTSDNLSDMGGGDFRDACVQVAKAV